MYWISKITAIDVFHKSSIKSLKFVVNLQWIYLYELTGVAYIGPFKKFYLHQIPNEFTVSENTDKDLFNVAVTWKKY